VTLRQKAGSSVQAAAAPYSICLDFAQFIGDNGRALLMQQQPELIYQRDNFCSIFVNIKVRYFLFYKSGMLCNVFIFIFRS
jgi:sulfur relay (sulfurtransferase) DsrF/TusC family protein